MGRPSTAEIKRRLVHASGSGMPLLYILGIVDWQTLGYLFVLASVTVTVLEILRLYGDLDWRIYDELTREYEQDNVAGYALYTYSQTAVALVFAPPVAVPGMLMLTIGDPISGLLGSAPVGEMKSLRTLAAMFTVCFALAAPFVVPVAGVVVGGVAAAAGALGATAADGVKPVVAGYVIDDNLSIPPVACTAIATVLFFVA
ncbi:dolichol kinase [Haloferax sp. MBLA0076]|uniref:Dolichol kinase n=1 Tax=Haloferax litoreum TaxID=2666140 RepID=A0A6A8GDX5_9EURY|nr:MULTISPECIES: dolichol kinase [Haloferax]KAB1192841.1 dolichol kinase [Haloferax sp. CBA1148]MRX21325.1 dolichol kinase [Haloferax litoreum]